MERDIFDRLFTLSVDELTKERSDAWDRWTWDSGSKADKQVIEDIDTMLEARNRLGLTGSDSNDSSDS